MYEKVKTGVVVFIILLFIFGCMSLKTHIPVNAGKNSIKYTKNYHSGSGNFVFLLKEVEPLICLAEECRPRIESTASGFVLSSDENSVFIITAAHFCTEVEGVDIYVDEQIIAFANDTPRKVSILYMDRETDLCMLHGIKEVNESFENIKIAENSVIGEKVYTVAAPDGIAGPGFRLIFDGIFSGCDDNVCMTTIPATFGSSGAGIFNMKGEVITIVMAVPENFNNVILSPSNKDLIEFIKLIDKRVDIYPYK